MGRAPDVLGAQARPLTWNAACWWATVAARAAIAVLLLTCVAVPSARAQIDSRFAAGAEFTLTTTDHASGEDYAHGKFEIDPLWRFGDLEPGWGFHWGLNWYAVDIDRPIGGATIELGELHIRPIMAGYGYTWKLPKRNAITADLLGGFAFGSMSIADSAVDAYRTRMGLNAVDADASNTFVLKPEIALWHDINKKLGFNINAGYMIARPEVTITASSGVVDRRTARADQFILKAGLVYSIF
jgi:hypothetical protein